MSHSDDNLISIINTANNTVTDTIDVNSPHGLAVTPEGKEAYILEWSGNVVVIDLATNTVTKTEDTEMLYPSIVMCPLPPAQKIQQMTITVQGFVTSGVLNKGQGNSLVTKLNAAKKNLDAGKNKAATNELNAFINHIKADIKTGKLSSSEGLPLIYSANAIIDIIK